MPRFTLNDEIMGHLRNDSEEMPLPAPKQPAVLLPWENPLDDYTPATGQGNNLAKSAEFQQLRETLLGSDIQDVLAANRETTLTALEKKVGALASQSADKFSRIAKSAPSRASAIKKIIDTARMNLLSKGFVEDSEKWMTLQRHAEEFVSQSLLAA